jgi:hypothetical protein
VYILKKNLFAIRFRLCGSGEMFVIVFSYSHGIQKRAHVSFLAAPPHPFEINLFSYQKKFP